jgi:hypothetical protein
MKHPTLNPEAPNTPTTAFDSHGDVAQVVAGALVGCAAGASFSLVTSWLAGDNACQCTCKAFGACGVGAVAGGLAAVQPAFSGCLAGLAGATISTLVDKGCDSACGQASGQIRPLCTVASIVVSTVMGCAFSGATTPTEQYLLNLIGNIVGFDLVSYCSLTGL